MKTKNNVISLVQSTPISEEAIRDRAYNIWLEAGKPHGKSMEHWLQAEEELLAAETGTSIPSNGKKARAKKTV